MSLRAIISTAILALFLTSVWLLDRAPKVRVIKCWSPIGDPSLMLVCGISREDYYRLYGGITLKRV